MKRPPKRYPMLSISAALLAALALTVTALTATARVPPRFSPPKEFSLAIGDSISFGQDETLVAKIQNGTFAPEDFASGYVDLFDARLATVSAGIDTVNYSCPGETTATFITGGCWLRTTFGPLPLHNNYPLTTSQLAVTLEFLRHHRGEVSPITLTLGADDFLVPFLIVCGGKIDCLTRNYSVPDILTQARLNLDAILTALRKAAPESEIIMLTYYNPFGFDPGPLGLVSNAIVTGLNEVIADVAAARGARVADAYTPINLGPQPETLCVLTLVCVYEDVHPTKAGYAVIAEEFWAASGYERLIDD